MLSTAPTARTQQYSKRLSETYWSSKGREAKFLAISSRVNGITNRRDVTISRNIWSYTLAQPEEFDDSGRGVRDLSGPSLSSKKPFESSREKCECPMCRYRGGSMRMKQMFA